MGAVEGTSSAAEIEDDGLSKNVTLHVYDVAHNQFIVGLNKVMSLMGSGAYHTAVEVEGTGLEFSYGYTEDSGTGVFGIPPKRCDAHRYRESLAMGTTSLSKEQRSILIDRLSDEWHGMDYDLLRHNCCHFCQALLQELGAKSMPPWILSLAGAGAELDDHFTETAALGREARGAPPLSSHHMGDYARGALVGVCIRGKEARGAPPTTSFRFGDFARGLAHKVIGGSAQDGASLTSDPDLGNGSEKKAAKPGASGEKPCVVWIDFKGEEAFEKSGIRNETGLDFKGFSANRDCEGYEGPAAWLKYILDRSQEPKNRVHVVILNKAQLQQVVQAVTVHCVGEGCEPPTFVVVSRKVTPDEVADFGLDAKFITSDWSEAANMAVGIINAARATKFST